MSNHITLRTENHERKQRGMYTGVENILPNSHPHPKSTLKDNEKNENGFGL